MARKSISTRPRLYYTRDQDTLDTTTTATTTTTTTTTATALTPLLALSFPRRTEAAAASTGLEAGADHLDSISARRSTGTSTNASAANLPPSAARFVPYEDEGEDEEEDDSREHYQGEEQTRLHLHLQSSSSSGSGSGSGGIEGHHQYQQQEQQERQRQGQILSLQVQPHQQGFGSSFGFNTTSESTRRQQQAQTQTHTQFSTTNTTTTAITTPTYSTAPPTAFGHPSSSSSSSSSTLVPPLTTTTSSSLSPSTTTNINGIGMPKSSSKNHGRFPCSIPGCFAVANHLSSMCRHKWGHLPQRLLPACRGHLPNGAPCPVRYQGRADTMKRHWLTHHTNEGAWLPDRYPPFEDLWKLVREGEIVLAPTPTPTSTSTPTASTSTSTSTPTASSSSSSTNVNGTGRMRNISNASSSVASSVTTPTTSVSFGSRHHQHHHRHQQQYQQQQQQQQQHEMEIAQRNGVGPIRRNSFAGRTMRRNSSRSPVLVYRPPPSAASSVRSSGFGAGVPPSEEDIDIPPIKNVYDWVSRSTPNPEAAPPPEVQRQFTLPPLLTQAEEWEQQERRRSASVKVEVGVVQEEQEQEQGWEEPQPWWSSNPMALPPPPNTSVTMGSSSSGGNRVERERPRPFSSGSGAAGLRRYTASTPFPRVSYPSPLHHPSVSSPAPSPYPPQSSTLPSSASLRMRTSHVRQRRSLSGSISGPGMDGLGLLAFSAVTFPAPAPIPPPPSLVPSIARSFHYEDNNNENIFDGDNNENNYKTKRDAFYYGDGAANTKWIAPSPLRSKNVWFSGANLPSNELSLLSHPPTDRIMLTSSSSSSSSSSVSTSSLSGSNSNVALSSSPFSTVSSSLAPFSPVVMFGKGREIEDEGVVMVVRGEEDMEMEMEMEQEEIESGSGSAGSARTITSLVVFPPMTIATATVAGMESAPIQGKQEEMEVVSSY